MYLESGAVQNYIKTNILRLGQHSLFFAGGRQKLPKMTCIIAAPIISRIGGGIVFVEVGDLFAFTVGPVLLERRRSSLLLLIDICVIVARISHHQQQQCA